MATHELTRQGTKFGLGRHEWDLNPATVIDSSMKIVKVDSLTGTHFEHED